MKKMPDIGENTFGVTPSKAQLKQKRRAKTREAFQWSLELKLEINLILRLKCHCSQSRVPVHSECMKHRAKNYKRMAQWRRARTKVAPYTCTVQFCT